MVMEAAADGNMRLIWFMLLFASAGVFHHAGIKIPFFAFFSHDPGKWKTLDHSVHPDMSGCQIPSSILSEPSNTRSDMEFQALLPINMAKQRKVS